MKILTINQSDTGGGAEKVAFQIVEGINKSECKNDFLVDIRKKDNDFTYTFKRNKVKRFLSKCINKFFSQQGICTFSKKIFETKLINGGYDIIHIHNLHGDYFDLENLKKIPSHIPVVITLHDIWFITGRCAIEYECKYWRKKCGMCSGKEHNTYPRMLIDNSSNIFEKKREILMGIENLVLVSPSNWMLNNLKESFLKDKKKILINNGVNLDIYKFNNKYELRKKYGFPIDKKYILFISAKLDDVHKGAKYLYNALKKLSNKEKYFFIIVGNKENTINIDGIDSFNFGYVFDEMKLNEIYSLADIFINPTLADNFPSTILESMASGTPVLATNIGGVSEQIDEECGWLVEKENLDSLNLLIEDILSNDKKLKKKSLASRKKIVRKFSLDKTVKEYKKLFEELIEN